jgi:hypothetical protein
MANDKYRPPQSLEYNEFVGELRPPNDRAFTELHVRYGVRKNLYLDWSITLRARLGDIEEYLADSSTSLERRTLEIVEVADSAIVRRTFNPYEPQEPPTTTVVMPLYPGDGLKVDAQYDIQMRGLSVTWAEKHGMPAHRHTMAMFGFTSKNRDPEFRDGDYSWVRNTLVCLSTDLSDSVITERSSFYFPETPSTAGVFMPNDRMKFIKIAPGGKLEPGQATAAKADTSVDGPIKAMGGATMTMGMLVDSIYAGDWTDGVEAFLGGDDL